MRKNERIMPLLNIFLHHWRLLLLCAVCFGVLGYLMAKYFIQPKYRADVTIYIGRVEYTDMQNNKFQRGEDPSATLSRDLYVGSQLVLDYTELAKSRMIQKRAREIIAQKKPEYQDVSFVMESNMRKNTRLMSLFVTAKDPQVACFIANTMSEVFVKEISVLLELKNFQIIDRAEKAVKTYPIPMLFAIVAALLSCGFMIVFFYFKAFFDTRIHTSEQITSLLKLPIIGSVPLDREMAKQSSSPDKIAGGQIVTLNNEQSQKRFGIREAFWGIRTNLLYSDFHSSQGARIIAVTSALPGEGKTFTATNLAATLADFGRRTLIINCDLRKPALSLALNTYSSVGLVNVLVDHYPVEKALLKNLFQRQLDALLCGPVPLNPLKLLDSEEFKNLLQTMRKEYDYIILDTPPCLEVSDGICLGKMVDGVILVSRLEVLREDSALALIDLLLQAKITPIGLIINGIASGHNGYYRDHYGHEASGAKKN